MNDGSLKYDVYNLLHCCTYDIHNFNQSFQPTAFKHMNNMHENVKWVSWLTSAPTFHFRIYYHVYREIV